MTILRRFFGYILALLLSIGVINSANAMYFSDFVYQSARRGASSSVIKFMEQGYDIDAVNPNGKTALCLAIDNNDFTSYNRIRKMGANAEPKCLKKVNKERAKYFANRYEKMYFKAEKTVAAKNSMKSNINLKTTGLVVAGTTAAALLLSSGGGGGSSSHNVSNPDNPNAPDNPGDSDNPDVPDNPNQPQCPDGEEFVIDECLPVCPIGTRRNGKDCKPIECPANTHLQGNRCVADKDIAITNENDDDIYGINSEKENVYNLFATPDNPEKEMEISIDNEGKGDVYGIFGRGDIFNVLATRSVGDNLGQGSSDIKITNKGGGNVYGIYSKVDDVSKLKEAYNAYSETNYALAEGSVNITNEGGGSTFGVFGDVRAYNARGNVGGQAFGDINIKADGDIYGLSGYAATTNAVSANFANKVVGNINLHSVGNGDVYGMLVSKDDIPGVGQPANGRLASWFAFNAYASGGEEVLEGNINIRNEGNGNVYGMYGGQQLFNAKSFAEKDELGNPTSNPKGVISVVNFGDGDVYGMYLPETDAQGLVENLKDNGAESYINLVNMGDGVTTGIRGGQLNTIRNTGEININNMGTGTAIGIYGAEGSNIYNNGLINIYRESFEDEVDGVTYNPTSENGGTAYGIYAEKAAKVINDEKGQIIIKNANAGVGVYLEEGATLENKGLISFNGVENSIVNNGAIVDIYGEGARTEGATVNINDLGGGDIVLGKGGQFFAKEMIGDMSVSNEVVSDGFKDVYVEKNALKVETTKDLNLKSKSAMFDASAKANENGGYDVVLERKNYADVVENKSLANLLETSYKEEKGEAVHDELKKAVTTANVNNDANKISGNDFLPHFRKEDKLVYSHISREINDSLFNRGDENYIAGYKYINISTDRDGSLVGSDGDVHAAYGLVKNKADNGIVYGLGASIAKLDSDYDNGATRSNNMFGLWLPVGYEFKNGAKWYSKLYAGYGDGTYDRSSSLGSYSADLKEYQMGISNEVRYSMNLGNGFSFSPLAELNLLNVHQDGFGEGNKSGALDVDSYNSLSLEGGVGAYLSKNVEFDADNSLAIRVGGIYYVEFLDPDDGMDVNIADLGSYKTDYREDTGRAVLSAKFDYRYKDLSLYAILEQEVGNNDAFTVDVGAQYRF